MGQKKTLAKGTIIKLDGTAYGRVETFDPPGQEYSTVEAPELNPQDDAGSPLAFDPVEFGDEIAGEFSFTHYWDPRHADATSLETKFGTKATIAVQIVTPHATSATLSFSGKIKRLGPQQLTKLGWYKREVVMVRTTAVTNAATP